MSDSTARDRMARSYYAFAGFRVSMTRREVAAGEADWDAGHADPPDVAEAYEYADRVHAEALEDDAAYRQNAEYRHRMQWQRTVDEDHAEALTSVNLAELTAILGQPEHDQQAVFSWTGETDLNHVWTPDEVGDLTEAWKADTDRIASES